MIMKNKSMFKIPILDCYYEFQEPITKCTIRWYNPINCNEQISVGVAKCNPMDTPDTTTGMRIAEGRAKMRMFDKYKHCAIAAVEQIKDKFWALHLHEAKHLQKLVDEIK